MSSFVAGTCGTCGGRVLLPTLWMGVVPPRPTCERCGATAIEGPVLPMQPKRSLPINVQNTGDPS